MLDDDCIVMLEIWGDEIDSIMWLQVFDDFVG